MLVVSIFSHQAYLTAHISVIGRDEVTDNDVCNGALYHHNLISAKAGQGRDFLLNFKFVKLTLTPSDNRRRCPPLVC